MTKKVMAYKLFAGAPLETDPKRAYAWLIAKESESKIGFTQALWIIENAKRVKQIIDEYQTEQENE
jgi:hypothetical protein